MPASWPGCLGCQIAIGTDDVYKTAEAVRQAGGKIMREPGPIPGLNTKIVACLDLDGWKTVRPHMHYCTSPIMQCCTTTPLPCAVVSVYPARSAECTILC